MRKERKGSRLIFESLFSSCAVLLFAGILVCCACVFIPPLASWNTVILVAAFVECVGEQESVENNKWKKTQTGWRSHREEDDNMLQKKKKKNTYIHEVDEWNRHGKKSENQKH